MKRKGIILAGGLGTRLYPSTTALSKHLLPVFNKPMIYYPLTTLMMAGIREFLLVSTPEDKPLFQKLLQHGYQWGIDIRYAEQQEPKGIAQALLQAEDFIGSHEVAVILGDNIFFGNDLYQILQKCIMRTQGASLFAYQVENPKDYGVISFNHEGIATHLEEKPKKPLSNFAVTGLYFYDSHCIEMTKTLTESKRGELEITDLNRLYLEQNNLHVEVLRRGHAWLDAGTHESLLEASQFIATLERRQGLKIACPEEIAYRQHWINDAQMEDCIQHASTSYGDYLKKLLYL